MRYLLFCFIFISLMSCNHAPENIALGTLERERISYAATSNEVIVALPVEQGAMVTAGTVLVRLDNTIQKAQVAKALAQVAQAAAYLEKLQKGARQEDIAVAQANVAGAKATLLESEANYKRWQRLTVKKLASQAELDRALASRDSELARLHSMQELLRALLKGTREEDLRIAKAQLQVAIATLTGEQKKLTDLTITANRDGILDNLPWNLGERVSVGTPLAIVLVGNAPYARVYIAETYRVKIKVNDKLRVHVDGIAQSIEGSVRWIANEPAFSPYYALNQQERARLMYLAEIQLPESAAYLPSGISAQVDMP